MQEIEKHNGPCKNASQVDTALKACQTQKERMAVLKCEVKYLKEILDIKDKRLVLGKKNIQDLSKDLKAVLAVSGCHSQQDSDSDSGSSDDEVAENDQRRKKWQISSGHCAAKRPRTDPEQSTNTTPFIFTQQGMWVAVAYENDFYIGQTTMLDSQETATVQFLNQGYQDIFRWPRVEDVADIESKFVFAFNFDVLSSNNGRTWSVPELDYLTELYQEYKDCYF